MSTRLSDRLRQAHDACAAADKILLGAGAGLSAAAGLDYGGVRFQRIFPDFIRRYRLSDMYSAMFYPFGSSEQRWAYVCRHILVNRFGEEGLGLYRALLGRVESRDYFVLTTNADGLFHKAGFSPERVFATQGDYGKLQCPRACHDTLYDSEPVARAMAAATTDLRVPTGLIPKCPRCGAELACHLRVDGRFVEGESWQRAASRYRDFLHTTERRRLLLIELGVGFNTPGIIKYPFEQLAAARDATLIRVNRDQPDISEANRSRTIVFTEPMAEVIARL